MALVVTLVLLALIPPSLFSVSLDGIIKTAYGSSEEIKRYELDRKNTELTVSIGEAKEELGISVTSGTVRAEYNPGASNYEFGTTGTKATVTLPNDGKTAITVGTGPVSYTTDSNYYALNPEVSASHTFLYGEGSDNRSTLLNKQSALLGTFSYQSNLIQFENSIINQIKALLTNEKSINETLKNIVVQQKIMSDALTLRTVGKDSVAYQELENSMTRLQGTLASLIINQDLLESQYIDLTSQSWNSSVRLGPALAKLESSKPSEFKAEELLDALSWEDLPSIREPNLLFEKNPNGNTSVALKGLALDLAQEDLKLAKANLTNKNLKIEGGPSFYTTKFRKTLPTSPPTYTDATVQTIGGNVGATFSAKNYSFGAGFNGSYNLDTNNFTPTLTVSGSWNNNPTQLTEKLNIQKLENSAMLASIAYNDALQDYLYSASSIQSQVASWQLEYALLERTISYNMRALEQQEALFAKGLTTRSSVDNARFAVGQDAYEKALTLIQGRLLENTIRSLQIQGR
jgi:hypothetical protein